LLISHNLAEVEHLATRVVVMYLGRIEEEAETRSLFAAPRHPYTKALLASEVGSSQITSSGRITSARAIATRWRCPPESWPGNAVSSRGASDTSAHHLRDAIPLPCTTSGIAMMDAMHRRGLSEPGYRAGLVAQATSLLLQVETRAAAKEERANADIGPS
jgi:ABC-type glutathione transport system ATPase component